MALDSGYFEVSKPVMTNADRIRSMTDEELADWLCYFVEDTARFNGFEDNKLDDGERDRLLGMLKQPAEGEL